MIATIVPRWVPAVGVLTVGLPRDALDRRLFGIDHRIWNLKVNARNTRHRFRQVRAARIA